MAGCAEPGGERGHQRGADEDCPAALPERLRADDTPDDRVDGRGRHDVGAQVVESREDGGMVEVNRPG